MELNEIIAAVTSLPVWVYVIAGLALVFLFGDRKLWDYEVKFPHAQGVGRGEVEFEGYKKKGAVIEVEFSLEPECRGLVIEVFLGGRKVHTIAPAKTRSGHVKLEEKIDLAEPAEGDTVTVNIGGAQRFEGRLVRD